jgi:hypothetical protein
LIVLKFILKLRTHHTSLFKGVIMKKFFIVLFVFILIVPLAYSQDVYRKGTNNLGIGIGPGLAGIYGTMSVPAISLGYQAGVHEKISVGGLVGYSSSTYDGGFFANRSFEWTYSYIVIGARGEYHFTDVEVENLDLYSGLTLGYTIVSVSEPSGYTGFYSAQGSYLLYGFHVGARYYFSPTIGAFLELGYGVGYIMAGITFKL